MPTARPSIRQYLAGLDAELAARGPGPVVAALGRYAEAFPEHAALTPAQRELLGQVSDAIGRVVRKHGRTDQILVIELMTLGKLGRFATAVRRARKAFADSPTWSTAVAAGNALRRAGKLSAAVEMFTAAADLDRTDVTALLEVGDIELEAGRTAEALAAYEVALRREKSQPWAEPSAWYCRYLLTGDRKWLRKLRTAATRPADQCGVESVLASLFGGYSDENRRSRAEYLLGKFDNPR